MSFDITKVVPGDIIKLKKPMEIASEKIVPGIKEDPLNIWSLFLKLGPRCELKVLQSTEDVITCRAVEIQNKMLRAYITIDFDPKKMDWDSVEVVEGKKP